MKNISSITKVLSILLLGIFYLNAQEECPPCEILANEGMNITESQKKWPDIKKQRLLKTHPEGVVVPVEWVVVGRKSSL